MTSVHCGATPEHGKTQHIGDTRPRAARVWVEAFQTTTSDTGDM